MWWSMWQTPSKISQHHSVPSGTTLHEGNADEWCWSHDWRLSRLSHPAEGCMRLNFRATLNLQQILGNEFQGQKEITVITQHDFYYKTFVIMFWYFCWFTPFQFQSDSFVWSSDPDFYTWILVKADDRWLDTKPLWKVKCCFGNDITNWLATRNI